MRNLLHFSMGMLGIGCVLCLFTSRESSRRLDHEPWYIAVELLTLALLVSGVVLMVVSALSITFLES